MKNEEEMNELMNENIETLRDWVLSLLKAAKDSICVSKLIAQGNDDSKYAEWLKECDAYEALIDRASETAMEISDARMFMAVLGSETDRYGHEMYESRIVGTLMRMRDALDKERAEDVRHES